jgi:hypothetical protein
MPLAIDDNVVWLDIAMDDLVLVQVVDRHDDFSEVLLCLGLVQALVKKAGKVAERHVLHDEVMEVALAEGERSFYEVWAVYHLEDIYFAVVFGVLYRDLF